MPSMERLMDATMMGLCYHPALRNVIVAGTAADVKEMLRMHTASVLRIANAEAHASATKEPIA